MERSRTAVTTARDANRVVGTITVAFVDDPAMRWLYPDASQYLRGFPKLVQAFAERAFDLGSAHEIADFAGAAIWLEPDMPPDKALLGEVIETTVDAQQASRIFEVLEQLDRCHPAEPHWYLPFIGVDAPRQGRGLGSLLLRHALEKIDREHRSAYLETANPANVRLYQRHGFELAETITLPSTPTMFPMVRRAR